MKKLKKLILLFSVVSIFSSCKKYGCTDPDAVNYDPKAEKTQGCKYHYANGVAINALPERDESGKEWDEFGAPDLYAKIYAEDGSAAYESELVTDFLSKYLPTSDFKLTNKSWKIELWDKDAPDADKLMFSTTFNPSQGQNDKIPLKQGNFDLTLQYFLIEEK